MEHAATKLFNKNFIMLVIGQIVSLFGNAILRFALPMYIYIGSASPELFGRVQALAVIPMIVISPFGGVLADRVNKKRLIVFLDFFIAIVSFIYLWTIGSLSIVPVTIVMLMILIATNGMMGSATDSSFPLIVPADQLVRSNSITMAINTLATMLGPMLGGILLVEFGLTSLLVVGGICFALAATMEMFIRIPRVKQKLSKSIIKLIAGDIKAGVLFVVKEQPTIGKFLLTVMAMQLVASSFVFIGIPVLVIQNLDMNERMAGIAMGFIGAGGIVGGVLSSILGKRVRIQKNHWMIFFAGLCFIPLGLAFYLSFNTAAAFITIAAMMFIAMGFATVFTIQILTYTQRVTPPELLGKVMALVITATVLAQPLGNWIYGILFERFVEESWLIIFPAAFLTVIIALCVRGYFKKIPAEQKTKFHDETRD